MPLYNVFIDLSVVDEKTFYKKKIIVTGHTGFKGRWLTILLKNLGANVNGISLKEKKNFYCFLKI